MKRCSSFCLCIYAYVYPCVCLHACTHVFVSVCACMHAHVCLCVCIQANTYAFVHIHGCVGVCMCACVPVSMCTHMCLCVCVVVCACTHVCLCVCMCAFRGELLCLVTILQVPSTLALSWSFTDPELHLASQATGQQTPSMLLPLPPIPHHWACRHLPLRLAFYIGLGA